ncbi:MAG: TetR/AcrR family transcriptional regulator [Gammaproteobacteria bacterium]|nr:MAG: TetR/AcrR family transcriptional regulator [Gammaproteobacteria bacterium]
MTADKQMNPPAASPVRGARTAKGAATRRRLIVAAEQAFAERGYGMTRVADIVRLAGVSQGNFYRHFRDKDDILWTVLDRLYEELQRDTRDPHGGHVLPTRDDLVARNTVFFRGYARNRHLLRVTREAAARAESLAFRELWLQMRGRFIHRTARWLQWLENSGSIQLDTSPQLLAEALGSLTEQLAYVQIGLPEHAPGEAAIVALGRTCGGIWYDAIFLGGAPVARRGG